MMQNIWMFVFDSFTIINLILFFVFIFKRAVMRLQITKMILALAVAGLVSACGNKIEESPDKMVRAGMQRMMKEDNQFNFSGSYRLEMGNQAGASTADKNSEAITVQSSDSSEEFLEAEPDYYKQQMESVNRMMGLISKSFSIPFTGAVDMRKGRMEVIPEFRYEGKNALISYKFPVYVDFNNLSLYMDTSAITNVSDVMNEQSNPQLVIGDRYVQLAVPQDRVQHLPIADLLKSLPKSVDDGYAVIKSGEFSKVSVDEFGKELEAKHQVKLNSSYAESLKYNAAMLQSLSQALKQAASKAGSDSKYQPQDYAVLQKIIDALASIYSDDNDGALAGTPIGSYMAQFKNKSIPIVSNFYFDAKGRIIGVRYQCEVPLDDIKELKGPMKIDYKFQLEYTGSPKFTMQPTPQNSVNIGSRLRLY
ncbi:hypothetical protein [Snodgrassella sp. ESL0253]|uniref:hypothetical protein n=1 Tax=Snodgrassella sp. ESL0253 TaxID=2705031 RepID=UPI0015830E6D|nr:hypothetical protein [Snodgrassella sp. ESL0253]NUE67163.1 hypothetical protein [Snodgrassella sp. ESL0253]